MRTSIRFVPAILMQAAVLCAAFAAAGETGGAMPKPWRPLDADGWTVLKPSGDSRFIYVSSSRGDDATGKAYAPGADAIGDDPFLPKGPVKAFKTVA